MVDSGSGVRNGRDLNTEASVATDIMDKSRVRKELKTSLNPLWTGFDTFHMDQMIIIANVTHSKINLNISGGKGILKILALCKKRKKEYFIFQTCLYFINEAKIIS